MSCPDSTPCGGDRLKQDAAPATGFSLSSGLERVA
jgi:hypothetical protein